MKVDAERKKFVDRAEEFGRSVQLELYKSVTEMVAHRYDKTTARKLGSALANYVFHFGKIAPHHAADTRLMRIMREEIPNCLAAFSSKFKANVTGVLIILAAASKVDLRKYKRHMQELAELRFVKTGADTPNVAQELPGSDLHYLKVCAGLKPK